MKHVPRKAPKVSKYNVDRNYMDEYDRKKKVPIMRKRRLTE